MEFRFAPIGVVRSCFPEKFGIPRQSGLVPEARARIELDPKLADALDGLEQVTHAWVIFVFHQALEREPQKRLTVRPPRLGGAKRMGVFATRSPHRPNPIGISACRILNVDRANARIEISGVDLLDGTPVLDIKPYVAYADSIPDARCDWAPGAEVESLEVEFAPETAPQLTELEEHSPGACELIRKLIALDPRPAHQADQSGSRYAMRILDVDVHWKVDGALARVDEIRSVS